MEQKTSKNLIITYGLLLGTVSILISVIKQDTFMNLIRIIYGFKIQMVHVLEKLYQMKCLMILRHKWI